MSQAPPWTISDGFMVARIVMEQVRVQKRGQSLDKEIEKQQQWSDCQQDGSTIDAAARGPGQATYEIGRASLTGDFFPKAVEFGGIGEWNDTAANLTRLVVHPDRVIEATRHVQ